MRLSLTVATEWLGFDCRRDWWLPRSMGYRSLTINLGFIRAYLILGPWKIFKKGETP